MSELSTDPSYGLTRRASQVAVVQACQRAIGHYTAMMQATLVELGEDVPFDVRRYVGDEIALALSLSPWTGRDLVEEAMLVSLVPAVWGLMSDGTLVGRACPQDGRAAAVAHSGGLRPGAGVGAAHHRWEDASSARAARRGCGAVPGP